MQVPPQATVSPTDQMRLKASIAAAICLLGFGQVQTHMTQLRAPSEPIRSVPAGAVSPSWTTYHRDNTRAGNDTTEGAVIGVSGLWSSSTTPTPTTLDGQVYATPLINGGTVYVATENNTLYAFNTSDGALQWSAHAGTPQLASRLPCGNIAPSVGVTGTPVIDPAAAGGHGMLFMVGMTIEPHYRLWGIDLTTHAVSINRIVDAGDILVQGQRGALALSRGLVYIPYGGRAGDCSDPATNPPTPYYGIIQAARETDGVAVYGFHPASTTLSGIWAPGGESIDVTGDVYVSTGNGNGPGTESVFKLSPSLKVVKQWRAYNHLTLDNTDQDVGSISPSLVGGGDVFQNGKYGHAFLLSSALGQLTSNPGLVDCGGLTSDASFGATAYAPPYIYVPCATGLYAVKQSGSSISVAWHALSSFVGPPIVAGGVVWTLSSGNLYGFNAVTGAPVDNIGVGAFSRFQTPASGGGLIFVAGTNALSAYRLDLGCDTANLTTTLGSPQPVGSSVPLTATATGPNCGAPQFEYWVQFPSGSWVMKRPFNPSGAWSWDTTGYKPGNYTIHVWANETGDPQTRWESFGTLSYILTGCTSVTLNPAPTSPQPRGLTVQFTATNPVGCPSPVYEFWLQYPSGTWVMKQSFRPSAIWNWDTALYSPGTYNVHVWANQSGGDMSTWQAYGPASYVLTVPPHCASASINPSSQSAGAGSVVPMTAISMVCPNPIYEFWVQYPNGTWHLTQLWGGSTFNWDTSGLAPGTYTVHVWANQAGDSQATWEAWGPATVTLT
jgi:outer membrane protein assembly factor BamB